MIIVGPTESQTNGYVDDAQAVAADAAGHGMDVVKLYTSSSYNTHARPGTGGVLAATWQNVVKYVNGADGGQPATIVAYMGHGNGWPNPYPPGYMMPDRVDGFVLDYSVRHAVRQGRYEQLLRRGAHRRQPPPESQRRRPAQPPLLRQRRQRTAERDADRRRGRAAGGQLRGRLPQGRRGGRLRLRHVGRVAA